MSDDYLRQRVAHFLQKKAHALQYGGDINMNSGLLIGGKRRVGRPKKTHIAKSKAIKHKPIKSHKRVAHTKARGGVRGNPHALASWRHFLDQYRRAHPQLPYREAQARASMLYHKR